MTARNGTLAKIGTSLLILALGAFGKLLLDNMHATAATAQSAETRALLNDAKLNAILDRLDRIERKVDQKVEPWRGG